MALPTDPTATKLRLKYEKAERVHRVAKEQEYATRLVWEAAWMEYVERYRALGYCVFCEKTRMECKCIMLGIAS